MNIITYRCNSAAPKNIVLDFGFEKYLDSGKFWNDRLRIGVNYKILNNHRLYFDYKKLIYIFSKVERKNYYFGIGYNKLNVLKKIDMGLGLSIYNAWYNRFDLNAISKKIQLNIPIVFHLVDKNNIGLNIEFNLLPGLGFAKSDFTNKFVNYTPSVSYSSSLNLNYKF